VRITGAILRSQNSILSVSTFVDSDFGINNVCLSVPCVVSDNGVTRIIESPLSSSELASLAHSAEILRKAIDSI
jgi:L-lactate dehydrogenase